MEQGIEERGLLNQRESVRVCSVAGILMRCKKSDTWFLHLQNGVIQTCFKGHDKDQNKHMPSGSITRL